MLPTSKRRLWLPVWLSASEVVPLILRARDPGGTRQHTPLSLQVDEKPSEDYSDVGGLDKQIKELVEAIVLPVTHKDKFKALGIRPPKGLLGSGQ